MLSIDTSAQLLAGGAAGPEEHAEGLDGWMVGPVQTANQDLPGAGKPGFSRRDGRGCMHGVVVVHLPPSPSSVMVDKPCLTISSQELS